MTDRIQTIVHSNFDDKDQEHVSSELSKLSDHWSTLDVQLSERTYAAILKYSNWEISKFNEAVEITKADWRDILMDSGFGMDVNKHKGWIAEIIQQLNN